jgi:hypothetical protein
MTIFVFAWPVYLPGHPADGLARGERQGGEGVARLIGLTRADPLG